jgi:hypothetical protein
MQSLVNMHRCMAARICVAESWLRSWDCAQPVSPSTGC